MAVDDALGGFGVGVGELRQLVEGFDVVGGAALEEVADERGPFSDTLPFRYPVVRLTEPPCGLLDAMLVREARDGSHLVDRGHVLAIDVLGERFLEGLLIRQLAHDDGDFGQTGGLRSSPASLAADELVATVAKRAGRRAAARCAPAREWTP